MIVAIAVALLASPAPPPPPPPAAPARPKLVVIITVDQLRPDYLDRWRAQLSGGLGQLVLEGAVFANAYQDHAVTETAPGHSTILSGRWPAHTGIISNDVGVLDSTAALIGVVGPGASPRRFHGSAFFDWLKSADPAARALSVSRKDRGAILPIGEAKEQVYWFQSGFFTTSRYYRDSLPAWVRAFNALRIPQNSAGRPWTLLLPDTAYKEPDDRPWENPGAAAGPFGERTFPHAWSTDGAAAASAFWARPEMDSLTLAFALAGADALKLARSRALDLLAVSLSTTDAVGHTFGPASREIHDHVLRLDRYLRWFFDQLYKRYGKDNLLVVLTADHGLTPFPAESRESGHAEARDVSIDTLVAAVNRDLDRLGGDGAPRAWLVFDTGMLLLKDNGRLGALGANVDSVLRGVAARIAAVPGVARVDRPGDFAPKDTATDPVTRRWLHQVPSEAGVALVVSLQSWCAWRSPTGLAMHGQPNELDSHVPLILWGRGVKRGVYQARANTVDIAPTLSRLLGVPPLALVDGRVLVEALPARN